LRCCLVISSARSPATTAFATAEPGFDYFATEAHYLSLAGRLAAASRDRRLVLVLGDPPANPQLISEALRKVTQGRRAVIDIRCGGELNFRELAGARCTQAAEPVPLFVFDEVDQLSDQQIVQICEAIPRTADGSAAAVLLARAGFSARLEAPSLQSVKEALTAQFRLDEIGEDESIDFLRHHLQARHRGDERRGIPPAIFRAMAAVGVVVAIGVGAMLAMHYIDTAGPMTGNVATQLPLVIATPPPPAAAAQSPPAVAAPSPPAAGPAPPAVARAPPASTAMSAAAAPAPDATPPQPVAPAASPPAPRSPAVARPPRAEIAALVTRGDDFLKAGDIASARLYYERAADAGDGAAALRLGATFDPGFLASAGVRGTPGDPARAASWYARALDLGEAAAAQRLKGLDHTAR
jgi:hypothetical protein